MKKINTISILMLILCLSLLNALEGGGGKSFSEREKRELASFPKFSLASLWNGEYFSGIDSYISDHFVQRDTLVDMNGKITAFMTDNKLKNIVRASDNTDIIRFDGASKPIIKDKDKIFFVFDSDDSQIDLYSKRVNQVAYKAPEGVKVSLMLVPTALEFIENSAEKYGVEPQSEALGKVSGRLSGKVNFVNVYDTLNAHKNEYIYFNSDHHWTTLGAYYGYKAFAESAGFEPVSYNGYFSCRFQGSFSGFTNDPRVQEVSDVLYLYKVKAENWCHGSRDSYKTAVQMGNMYYSDQIGYTRILGGDTGYIRIETLNKSGRNLMIIKDSYANAMVPYLTEYFKHITIIDPRYFADDLYETMAHDNITDVLFVNNIETISDEAFLNKLTELAKGKNNE